MDSMKKEFRMLEDEFKQHHFKRCSRRLEALRKTQQIKSSDGVTLFNVVMENNKLICEYLESRPKGIIDSNGCASLQKGFYGLIKECIFKTNSSEVELVVINNTLQCCCSHEPNSENGVGSYECIAGVVTALKKVLAGFVGLDFRPPIAIKLGDPSTELVTLIEDVVNVLPKCDMTNELLLSSCLTVLLQVLFVLSHSSSNQAPPNGSSGDWRTSVLESLSLKVTAIIKSLKLNETYSGCKPVMDGTDEETKDPVEECGMEVDIDVKESTVLGDGGDDSINNVPMFSCNVFGDIILLKDYLKPNAMRNETVQSLLYTLSLVRGIFCISTINRDYVFFKHEDSTNLYISKAWKYLEGYTNFKSGRLKEAMAGMENLDFSSFPLAPHFKSKRAILTAAILSKLGKHLLALTILNQEAMDCEDCLPYSLFYIANAYENLNYKDSQLEALRKLVKVLRHKNHLDTLKHGRLTLFLRTIDSIHPLHGVTLENALEKLALGLAQNKLYEESAECYLDLLALLEKTGPARKFRHHLQNAAAALLLVSENTKMNRTKDAISLCNKATSISQKNKVNSSSLKDSSADGPSASKRAKLELDIGEIIDELDSAEAFEGADVACDMERDDAIEIQMVEVEEENGSGEVSPASIYSSLSSSDHDLLASILLSDCYSRENDFSRSLHLLNRCLQYLSRLQVLERRKEGCRDSFIDATNFMASHVWLRKAKVLMKKESLKNVDFSKDIEHCLRSALIRCPGNIDAKYHYVDCMMAAERKGILSEIQSISQPNISTHLGTSSSASLAIGYLFQSQVTEVQFEELLAELKGR